MKADDDSYEVKLLSTELELDTFTYNGIDSNTKTEFPSVEDAINTEKDGCWAWIVCAAAFCDLFVVLGMHYSVGVLYAALLDHFRESKAKTGK